MGTYMGSNGLRLIRGIFGKLPTELDFFHRRFENDGLFEAVNGRNVCR